ncbi:3'-5' DNA helicase [Sticta canariensis]|nr:3'-5' DNA helicase [Sticta canariensis]
MSMSNGEGEERFEDLNEGELLRDHQPSRARKRRRLDLSRFDDTENHDRSASAASDETAISPPKQSYRSENNNKIEVHSPTGKPDSECSFHIPKNSEVPKDAQPPQKPNSDRKPQRQPTSLSPGTLCTSKLTPHLADLSEKSTLGFSSDDEGADESLNSAELAIGGKEARSGNRDLTLPQHDTKLGRSRRSSQSEFNDSKTQDYEAVLADLPSDAFSSSASAKSAPASPILVSSQQQDMQIRQPHNHQRQGLVAAVSNLRQTTLFGAQAQEVSAQSQSTRKRNWPLANREEPPTHHKLNRDALGTWVYPTNLGTIRDYQYSIVARGLYHNMLVALPTGLGKTFIAAVIMLNWFRWTTEAQIVFVAPTKPLVSQQVKACFGIAGIPPSATTMLTGGIPPGIRAEEWLSKRVFFMTPQTIINDLKTGICDPKRIVLLVVDEAHRATGSYAYVEVVKFLNRFNSSFRVLALTATPGSSIEGVQEVIDGLGISMIEIRTEESIDIRQYVHPRKVDTVLFDNSEEMVMIMDLFAKALQPVLDKLNGMNAYWQRDPMSLTPYGCNQARMTWMASDAGKNANWGVKGMVNIIFSLLASLSHGTELLKFHGIGPFFHKVLSFREGDGENTEKGGKYRKQIIESIHFQTMMTRVQSWINQPDFVGHPKLEYLQSIVLRHFADAGEGRGASDPTSTRIMVFAHYRDSAEEIVRVLRRNDPMIRPHVFVGQSSSKGSEGMDQKTQLAIIQKFQDGIYNTLVATSIGEEGLDIGEVDLIVCYDASASPIRMLQRMGRTGRKRAGTIVVTLMRGKEENNFIKAKDNYEKMQNAISAGTQFNFHEEQSRRIVPKEIQPIVDKKFIEIPPENSQADLPEPKKRGKAPKKPAKKFHMPDGVRHGFVKASRMERDEAMNDASIMRCSPVRKINDTPEPIPSLDEVLLTTAEQNEFVRSYLNIEDDAPQVVDIPRLDAFPDLQRSQRPTKDIKHGRATSRFVNMLGLMRNASVRANSWYSRRLQSEDREGFSEENRGPSPTSASSAPAKTDKPFYQSATKPFETDSDSGEDLPELSSILNSDLLRRLPPHSTTQNLNRLCALAPHLTEDLLSAVDQPLEVRRCKRTGRDYLLCDYNRDGDSWRSPWSNEFEPPLENDGGTAAGEDAGGAKPGERVRALEIRMGEAIDVYRELYYEGGTSSVYFWDLDDGFAGVVLLKKTTPKGKGEGEWDSIHVFEAIDRARTAHYKLTSTVILRLSTESDALGEMDLSGNMTRQIEQDMPVLDDSSHIINVGKLVEDMELKMRNLLQEVYFGKAKDVVGDLRSILPLTEANREKATHQEMINSMKR